MSRVIAFCLAVFAFTIIARIGAHKIESDKRIADEVRILQVEKKLLEDAKKAAEEDEDEDEDEDEEPEPDDDPLQDPLCRNRLNPQRFMRK